MNSVLFRTRLAEDLNVSISTIFGWIKCWKEPHRFYHNINHLFQVCDDVGVEAIQRLDVRLAILFHDIIYDPTRKDNEEKSIEFFLSEMPKKFKQENPQLIQDVVTAIRETKHDAPPVSELGKIVCKADIGPLVEAGFGKLMHNELNLFKEFQMFPWREYQIGRMDFLSKWTDKNPAITPLVEFIRGRKPNIGIYAGSFDPWTIGHQNILDKAEKMFDKVIIARGQNTAKGGWEFKLPDNLWNRETMYIGNFATNIDETKKNVAGMVIPEIMCAQHLGEALQMRPYATLIRGLRGASDLESEKTQQIFVEDIVGHRINTVYITCDRSVEHVSSSAVKQVIKIDPNLASRYCPSGLPFYIHEFKSV